MNHFGAFRTHFGAFWSHFGAFWNHFGPIWIHFAAFWSHFLAVYSILVHCGCISKHLEYTVRTAPRNDTATGIYLKKKHFGITLCILDTFWSFLAHFRALWMHFEAFLIQNALKYAKYTKMYQLAFHLLQPASRLLWDASDNLQDASKCSKMHPNCFKMAPN